MICVGEESPYDMCGVESPYDVCVGWSYRMMSVWGGVTV